MSSASRRVVISGMGVVSPLGIGVEEVWQRLRSGTSGVGPIDLFNYSGVPGHFGGQVREFNDKTEKKLIKLRKNLKFMCRDIKLGVASATQALEHAGIADGSLNPERIGIEFGANLMLSPPDVLNRACMAAVDPETGKFVFDRWGGPGLGNMDPLWLLLYLPNMPACHIAITHDTRGPSNSMTLAEASANSVIGEASRIILRGAADVMITGATGTTVHPVKTIHAVLWDQLADPGDDPTKACRPFDLRRTGQVIGEGAATFILEEEEHATQRGAKVYGVVLGTGFACVTDRTGRPDFRTAFAAAMRNALRSAGVTPAQIGHVNAHGLATTELDPLEAQAIHDVFGDLGSKVPVTAFKSYWGNSGASCGALELAASLLGLQHGVILPTLNYTTPDPACPLNVVHGEPRATSNKLVLSVNVTRMGQASAVVVQGA